MQFGTLCYVQRGRKTLLLHRVKKQNDMHEGKWTGPCGKLLDGESPEECVIREVQEESGLLIRNPKLRGILTFPAFDGNEPLYVFVYTTNEFAGELIDSNEGNLSWIPDAEVPRLNRWDSDNIFWDRIREGKFFSAKFWYGKGKLLKHKVFFSS